MRLLLVVLLAVGARAELIDLSHPVDENARIWPVQDSTRYKLSTLSVHDPDDQDGEFYITKNIEMTEHLGTHMDAPHHFGKTAWDLASIPITNFVVPVAKIDVRKKCEENRDYALSVQDLWDWEGKYGKVPENAVLLMETGWGDKYLDTLAYTGTDRDQRAEDFDYAQWATEIHFPGFSAELADELLANYTLAGVGIDTASIDPAVESGFPVHYRLQGNNIYGLENLCCLDKVPARGATIMAIPPKIIGGSGFTLRVLLDTDSTFTSKQSGVSGAYSSGAGTQIFLLLICLILFIE